VPSNQKSQLRRGFKAASERKSLEFRERLNLRHDDFLPPRELAQLLSVFVHDISEYPGDASSLYRSEAKWSAFTIRNRLGERLIVFNSYHSESRQNSDLMHELAHIICDHQEPALQRAIPIPSILRNYDSVAEEEATYLGGCLHIPRKALLDCIKMRMSESQIAEKYVASLEMVRYRIRVTGVQLQSGRWKY
jgi:hypothetical protein